MLQDILKNAETPKKRTGFNRRDSFKKEKFRDRACIQKSLLHSCYLVQNKNNNNRMRERRAFGEAVEDFGLTGLVKGNQTKGRTCSREKHWIIST